jgi:hypothetical protein
MPTPRGLSAGSIGVPRSLDPEDLPRDVGEMVYPVIWRGYKIRFVLNFNVQIMCKRKSSLVKKVS